MGCLPFKGHDKGIHPRALHPLGNLEEVPRVGIYDYLDVFEQSRTNHIRTAHQHFLSRRPKVLQRAVQAILLHDFPHGNDRQGLHRPHSVMATPMPRGTRHHRFLRG